MEIPNGKVLIDFWSPSCAPCMMLMSTINELDIEYSDLTVIKVNVLDNLEDAQDLGVMSLPTLVFFNNGEERERLVGFKVKSAIIDAIERL
jgi:thioredoxin 1